MGSNTCPGAWYWPRPHTAALRARPHSVLTLLSLQPLPGQQQEPALLKAPGGRQARAPRAAGGGGGRRRQEHDLVRLSRRRPRPSSANPGRILQQPSPRGPRGSPPASVGPAGSHSTSGAAGGCGATLNSGPARAHHNPRLLSPRGRGVTHEFWGTDKTGFQLHKRCRSTQR